MPSGLAAPADHHGVSPCPAAAHGQKVEPAGQLLVDTEIQNSACWPCTVRHGGAL